jgi:hypothetical protein
MGDFSPVPDIRFSQKNCPSFQRNVIFSARSIGLKLCLLSPLAVCRTAYGVDIMTNSARFQFSVSTTRPRGARVIESYSPKLGRRLQCFGEDAFRQWICLEANPSIEAFCERPIYLTTGDKRLVDYWVRQADGEMLLVISENSLAATITIDGTELLVRTILPIDLAAARVWTENWERMLPAIISCRELMSTSLLKSVVHFVSEPTQLSRIEQGLGTGDLALVRAAVFTLLHRGQLQAPQLCTEPLSFLTCFHPVNTP